MKYRVVWAVFYRRMAKVLPWLHISRGIPYAAGALATPIHPVNTGPCLTSGEWLQMEKNDALIYSYRAVNRYRGKILAF